jgi:hypothetical protein
MTQVMDFMFREAKQGETPGWCMACHNGVDLPPPIIPRTPKEFYALVTSYTTKKCFGYKLVVPGDPDKSALALVLEGKCEGGLTMPDGIAFDGPTQADFDGIRSWIKAGAKM